MYVIIPTNGRWIVLAVLAAYLLVTGRLLPGLRSDVGPALVIYAVWGLCTYFWSNVPQLTLMKSVAFALVSVTLLSAGQAWVRRRGVASALSYLAPVAALAMFAGVLGRGSIPAITLTGPVELYQGLTGNPNMLGSMMAMSVPYALWQAYRFRQVRWKRWLWLGLLAALLGFLLLSVSRSAILVVLFTGLGFLLAVRLRRKFALLLFSATAALMVTVAVPTIMDTLERRYVLKGGDEVFATRERPWEVSYEAAKQGGLFGAGYGVSIGHYDFDGSLTAVGYGREKGSAQLAVWEETGIVGLALYALLLVVLFRYLIRAFRRAKDPDSRVAMGILTGALAGGTVQTIFEAWWVAPGSPEAVWFWASAGVAIGLAREVALRERLSRQEVQRAAPAGGRPVIVAPSRRH